MMYNPDGVEKVPAAQDGIQYEPSSHEGVVGVPTRNHVQYLKHYFTSREGWIGDYVCPLPLYSTPSLYLQGLIGLCLPHHAQHLAPKSQI